MRFSPGPSFAGLFRVQQAPCGVANNSWERHGSTPQICTTVNLTHANLLMSPWPHKNMQFIRANQTVPHFGLFWDAVDSFAGLFDGFYYIFTGECTSKVDKFDNLRTMKILNTPLRVGLSPNGLPAACFRDKWQIWDGKRKTCFSPSWIVTFLPVQKSFVPAGPKCDFFREGCVKKRHKLKLKFRVRERHTLPRNVTNVTRHIFCHWKKWQMWRHSPKSETGSWEEIRLRPTLTQESLGIRTKRREQEQTLQTKKGAGLGGWIRKTFVLTLFICKVPNYLFARTLTERVV